MVPRVSKNYIFKHGHVAYQIDGNKEYNRIQVKFSPYDQTGALWVRSKGQIFNSNHKDFYTKLCVLTKKRNKTYRLDYSFCGLRHA